MERIKRAVPLGDSFMPVDSSSHIMIANKKTEI